MRRGEKGGGKGKKIEQVARMEVTVAERLPALKITLLCSCFMHQEPSLCFFSSKADEIITRDFPQLQEAWCHLFIGSFYSPVFSVDGISLTL